MYRYVDRERERYTRGSDRMVSRDNPGEHIEDMTSSLGLVSKTTARIHRPSFVSGVLCKAYSMEVDCVSNECVTGSSTLLKHTRSSLHLLIPFPGREAETGHHRDQRPAHNDHGPLLGEAVAK